MIKAIVTIILLVVMALILFWRQLKTHVWLRICRMIFNHLMGGKK
ncbi:MAG TPA: hypothetical protein VHY08_15750 [Bacillota bacterium]|nr:hypothetical protein [Bacillota bacterium]